MLKIKPLKGIVYLKLDEAKAGNLVTTSRESAVEFAEVLAVGEGTYPHMSEVDKANNRDSQHLKVGDKIFVKSWAVDIISHNDRKFYFCNIETGGIIAVVS